MMARMLVIRHMRQAIRPSFTSSTETGRKVVKRGEALLAVREQIGRPVCEKGRKAFVSLTEAMNANRMNSNRSTNWYLDSGASDHMTYCWEWLFDYEKFDEAVKVRIGNGSFIYAEGQGNVNVLSFDGSK